MNSVSDTGNPIGETRPHLLYISTTLPALTLTFVYREIWALEALGHRVTTVSMNRPSRRLVSDEAKPLLNRTLFLDSIRLPAKLGAYVGTLLRTPGRFLKAHRRLVQSRPLAGPRDFARLFYHLVEACWLNAHLPAGSFSHIHAHFISGPTSLAMFLGCLRDVPFSFTMHASLLWQDPIALRTKLEHCRFCASISAYNRNFVVEQYGNHVAPKIRVVHCGIDPDTPLRHFSPKRHDGPVRLLSVGQLVARKGFHILLPAIARARELGSDVRGTLIGDGPLRKELVAQAADLGIDEYLTFAGALDQEAVQTALSDADLFVLPCVITPQGGRDGIPVALMEAMMAAIPVVSTNILGLPELIEDGVSGVLVSPDDSDELADAIAELAKSGELRRSLGDAGRNKVLRDFNQEVSAKRLSKLFSGSVTGAEHE